MPHQHDHHGRKIKFFGSTELLLAVLSGVFWIIGLLVHNPYETISFGIAIICGGYYTFLEAFESLRHKKFQIDFLMLVAAIGAAALGEWGEGALLLFLFSLGHALEHYALSRARKSIKALSALTPDQALLIDQQGKTTPTKIKNLQIGQHVLVKPNSKIPVDGIVISGESVVNQAPITGESIPVHKYPHKKESKIEATNQVFAGTINGQNTLTVEISKLATDTTLARLIDLVKEAESQKSPTQHLADQFEKYYVPSVLILVTTLLLAFLVRDETFQESFYRAMAVLIAASPCALAISTPSAVLSGIARAAKMGVLIKGGGPLEALGNIEAIAFDKTGTLTNGTPKLTQVYTFGNTSEKELLEAVIAVEQLSDHPLAEAIVQGGKEILGYVPSPASDLKALIARGVQATWKGTSIHIGNRRLLKAITHEDIPSEIEVIMTQYESAGNTAMIVHQDQQYLGVIAAMDVARPKTKTVLHELKNIGIKKMVMLTGDHQKVANAIADEIGITHPLGSLLPEDKVAAIDKLLAEKGGVAMVGDGVNDAPAMAKSTVGIAMGAAGSAVALETADIALMADKLERLPFAIGLSRKAHQIIQQNLWISLGMVAILVPLTILDIAAIGPAVIAHEGSTLLVVLNALRLLNYE